MSIQLRAESSATKVGNPRSWRHVLRGSEPSTVKRSIDIKRSSSLSKGEEAGSKQVTSSSSQELDPARFVGQVLFGMPFTVSVVIPTLNEEKNLPGVLPRIPSFVSEIVVVDGFSTDGTLTVVQELAPQARIISQSRRGKGNAMAHGFAEATGDIIVMLDADGSADPSEIERFVVALLQGADFVKGSRYACGGGSSDLSWIRNAGNWGLTRLVNVAYGAAFTDLCYGYNAFWRRHVPTLGTDVIHRSPGQEKVWGDGFEIETLIMVRAILAGLHIVEIPSFEYDRMHGDSNLNTFRDGYRVLRTALQERIRS